ncbi:MAG: hypothetical protein ACREGF_03915, partial [Candidatus Saccharimonadales bacterium]
MSAFKSKYGKLAGTTYDEAVRSARREYRTIQHLTKRQPYVRSKYFDGDKVFINIFFNHLVQKRKGEQLQRAKLFLCAIDLLRNTTNSPQTIFKRANLNEILHRFEGFTKDGELFYVQVKQNKRTGRKDFMSV